jgi:hypothetical protein
MKAGSQMEGGVGGGLDSALIKGGTEVPDINFLTNIDFSQIDEMDPNLFNGHKVIFDQEVELEVTLAEDNGKHERKT